MTTHPIQYHAPWFRELAAHPQVDLDVLYCHNATPGEQAGAGFGVEFNWDVSLLSDYQYRFLENTAPNPTVHNFQGMDTPGVRKIIAEEKFDAVIVNGWHYKSAWQTMRACWKTQTPVMMRSDSHLRTERSSAKQIAKWPLYRWFIPKLDACLPVGQWSRDYFLHYGADPNKVFVVPHTVDDTYFSREAARLRPRRSELRKVWGLDEKAIVFVFVGKLIEKKRPMDFLRAMKVLAGSGVNVAGLLVGDGPLRAECEQFIQRENLPVHMAGFLNQSRIAEAYVASDALVLPSDGGETWGLVVNEAMACGIPCFVSDRVGCGPDMIAGPGAGRIFSLGNTDELANWLLEFAQDESMRTEMAKQAGATAASRSMKTAVAGTLEAVKIVLKERQNKHE
ncbi:MAG TPA: glycosyltransferase family 4 protein [Pyrinomonadaceae bacterium]|nr:glycosyltransferase family 4 protein [Pyrinomonadaceae bacterium]